MQIIRKFISIFFLCCCSLLKATENPTSPFSFEEEEQKGVIYEFVGYHRISSYMGCDLAALTNFEGLNRAMNKAVEASGATLLQAIEHIFPPQGYSMIMLLSESHASIHTYPEHGACFIDFFTCGRRCSSKKFDEVLREYLKPQKVNYRLFLREEQSDTDVTPIESEEQNLLF